MFILYLLLWIVFSAGLSAEICLIGLLLSGLAYWFACRHLGFSPRSDHRLLRRVPGALHYALVLVWETIRSNVEVSRIVFSKTIQVEPRIVFFTTGLKTDAARVALANSITLTPGTITVFVQDDLFCVHCLNREMAEGLADSRLVEKLRKLES